MPVNSTSVNSSEAEQAAAAVAARLADPQVARSLTTLLDHLDLLALLVEGLDQMVSRSEVIGDSLLAGVTDLRDGSAQSGVDLAAVFIAASRIASVLPKAAPRMVSAIESGAVDKMLATAEVSAEALPQVELLAQSLVNGTERFRTDPVTVSGPVTLVKLMRDPDITRAISFLATVAKSLGQDLATVHRH